MRKALPDSQAQPACCVSRAGRLSGNRPLRRLRFKNVSSTLFSTALGYNGIGLVFCKVALICSLWCYISAPTRSGVEMLHICCARTGCLLHVRAREEHPMLTWVKAKSTYITRLVKWSQGMWDVYTSIWMYIWTYLHTYTMYLYVYISEKNKFKHCSINSLSLQNMPYQLCYRIGFLQV